MRLMIVCCCVVMAMGAWAAPDPQGELIFPLQDKHCHGSSIVECPNGDLLACWFFGSGERSANDVLIQGARLAKGSTAWSPVFEMADTPGFPDCNPVLYIDAKDRLWLFWIPVLANRWENSLLMYRRAENYLQPGPPQWSWQDIILFDPGEDLGDNIAGAFKHLPHDESMWGEYAPPYSRMLREAAQDKLKRQIGWMTRIHPLTLPNGRILLPLYSDGFNISMVAISDDTGETWRPSKPIIGLGPIQPTLARRNDGTIIAYMRDSGSLPKRVLKATSQDDGESWSLAINTDIPNPSSSLEVIVLEDGRWVMIFNDTEQGRHSLALAMSGDEGKTWKWKRHIEQGEPGKTGYGYPSMIQTKDGMLHVTYTFSEGQNSIKHLVIHPDWITG